MIPPEKPKTKKETSAFKLNSKNARKAYQILLALRNTEYHQSKLANYLGLNRSTLSRFINKLINANLVWDTNPSTNKWKFYKLTAAGSNFLAQYENTEKKNLVGIENARWKCLIKNTKNLQKFLFENGFEINSKMQNWIQWNGKIQGFNIQINLGVEPSLVITHPPHFERDIISGYLKVQEHILTVISNLNKKWQFQMSIPEPVPTRQFTIANEFADHLMQKTGGSQIKVGKTISFDQSGKTEPRFETSVDKEAVDFASMPTYLKKLLEVTENSIIEQRQTNEIFSKAIETIIKNQSNFDDKFTQLISNVNQQQSVKELKLNPDSEKMFQ